MAQERKLLGKILVDLGVVGMGPLQAALAEQRRTGQKIGQVLLGKSIITEDDLARALAIQNGLEWLPAATLQPEPAALALLDAATARAFGALPLSVANGVLHIVVADPDSLPLLADL